MVVQSGVLHHWYSHMAPKQSQDAPGDTGCENQSAGLTTRIRKFNPKDVFTW